MSTNYAVPTVPAPEAPKDAAAPAPAQQAPRIVSSLEALHASQGTGSGPSPKNDRPLPYPINDDHKWVDQMKKLQMQIEEHEKSLASLDKEVEAGRRHKKKLQHAQKLLHSMVSLHQSENVLSLLDKHIEEVKGHIKKLGDDAEDAVRNVQGVKKQLQEEMAKHEALLQAARKKLAAHEATLTKLCDKRSEVATVVQQWRDFVASLKAAVGIASGGKSLTIPKLPHPPAGDDADVEDDSGSGDEEEQAADPKAEASGEKPQTKKKSKTETIETAPAEPEAEGKEAPKAGPKDEFDASEITALPHEIQATHNGIEELLSVHLPRITGQSFVETAASMRRANRGLRSRKF